MQLPADIILGIWLHHSQTGVISQAMPQARIAAVVELADSIVRRAGIGDSGSYDEISPESIAGSLGLTAEKIRQVEQELPDIVRQKSEVAGLTLLKPAWAYCDALRATTGQLADESAKLFEESGRLQSSASNFDFIRELLPKISPNMPAIRMAEEFAVGWQKFYQTGPVCVYLVGEPEAKVVEAVVAGGQGKSKTVIFDVPAGAKPVPEPVSEKFAVIDAADNVEWLFDQVDVEFNLTQTKLAPLQADGRTVGIIVFELRHPAKGDISQRFESAARFGAIAIDMLEAIDSQQRYAEGFAQLFSEQNSVSGSPAAYQASRHSGTGSTRDE
jgi:hypothetical protein